MNTNEATIEAIVTTTDCKIDRQIVRVPGSANQKGWETLL